MAAETNKPLNEVELLHCLEKLASFPVSIEDLRAPTPQFMENIFECVMKDMMLNVDAVRQAPWKANLMIDHKESYEHVLPLITFYSLAREIMQTAGMNDFCIQDLTEPKRKRTKKILNYLIVLWKHVLLKLGRYRDVEAKCVEEFKQKSKLKEELKSLQEKYAEMLTNKRGREKNEHLMEQYARKEEQLNRYVRERDALQKKHQKIKTQIAAEQRELNELDLKIVSEQEKLADLDNRILPSPARLNTEIEDLKQKVADEDLKILNARKSVKEKYQEKEMMRSKLDSIKGTISDVTQLVETMHLFKEEITSVADLHKMGVTKIADVKAKQANIKKLEDEVKLYEQKKVKMQLQHKTKLEHLKKMCSMKEESVVKEEAACESLRREKERLEEYLDKLKADLEAQEKEKEEIMCKSEEELRPLQQQVLDYLAEKSRDANNSLKVLQELKKKAGEKK